MVGDIWGWEQKHSKIFVLTNEDCISNEGVDCFNLSALLENTADKTPSLPYVPQINLILYMMVFGRDVS